MNAARQRTPSAIQFFNSFFNFPLIYQFDAACLFNQSQRDFVLGFGTEIQV